MKDGGLPLYVRFCSAAFDLPEKEVAAAFSPEGTLRKREIITLDPENSDLRYLQYWFQPYNPSEVQGLFKLVPMPEQDWIHRWLTPTKNTVGALPELDTIPGIASLVTPMLAKALEDNIQGVHVVLRSMDDGVSRIVASHIARALDMPLYQLLVLQNRGGPQTREHVLRPQVHRSLATSSPSRRSAASSRVLASGP